MSKKDLFVLGFFVLVACGGDTSGDTAEIEEHARATLEALRSNDRDAFVRLSLMDGDTTVDGERNFATHAGGNLPDAEWTRQVEAKFGELRKRIAEIERESGPISQGGLLEPKTVGDAPQYWVFDTSAGFSSGDSKFALSIPVTVRTHRGRVATNTPEMEIVTIEYHPTAAPVAVAKLEIRGTVTDQAGAPIPRARVTYYRLSAGGDPSWAGQVQADEGGEFTIGDLEEADYQLHGKADGYVEVSIFAPDAPRHRAGASEVVLSLEEGGSISGRLLGIDARPLANANVVLRHSTEQGAQAQAMLSGEDGAFEFSGLTASTYTLLATDSDLNEITEDMVFELTAGEAIVDVVLRESQSL